MTTTTARSRSTSATPVLDGVSGVEAFLGALERLDIDAAMALADEDIVYQNVPLPPSRGKRATERVLRTMLRPATGFEARMLNIARTAASCSRSASTWSKPALPDEVLVCGTFEVRDDRIALWRDRFDFADTTVALVPGLAGLVAPALNRR